MKIITKLFNKATEIIFPNNCILCNKIISRQNLLCDDDFSKLKFITEPKCQICSNPLNKAKDGQEQAGFCANCLAERPDFDRLITVFYYNSALKKIIGNFKYYDHGYLADKLGLFLYQEIRDCLNEIDVVAIVPLHKNRLQKRKFNQSALLAKSLICHANKDYPNLNLAKKFIPDLLIKVKNTKPQVSLNQKDRKTNLLAAFRLRKKYWDLVKNQRILLIDDVVTTAATAQQCARKLKIAQAKVVTVLTIAKSIR